MNKWVELLVGLILVVGSVYVVGFSAQWKLFGLSLNFGPAAWSFLKGGLIWFVAMVGLLFVLLGISDLKE